MDKWLRPLSGRASSRGTIWLAVLAGGLMVITVIAVWYSLNDPGRDGFGAEIQTRSLTFMLVGGMLFSLLLAMAVFLARTASLRARQLRDTAVQLAALFQNLPGMAYRYVDLPNWPMEFVSEGCQNLSGYSRREFEERSVLWGELIHPDDRERVCSSVQQAINANASFETEYRIITRANGERWVWERGRAISPEDNDVARLEGIVSDISDRKDMEIRLDEARAFSEAVVESAVEAIITIDTHAAIRSFNPAARQMFGYSGAELQGQNINVLMPDPYHVEHDGYIRRYLETNEARIIGIGRDVSARRKDGSVFPIHLSVSEVGIGNERVFVGLIRDISLQRSAERDARQQREQLAHADRLNTLGEMATGIAHEINQPLTAISLFSQAGKRFFEAGNEAKMQDIFDKISQHAQRAGAVIERMQNMSRHRESAREVVGCNSLIEEVARLAEAEARIRDIVIEVIESDGLPEVNVDTVQIQQVALNLLRNGMQAMHQVNCRDGNIIKIQTRLRDDGDIEVAVIDTGTGVAEEVAAQLFVPFSTTKASGMGMGLPISRAIITAHGGQLAFVNNLNDSNAAACGATFYFTLPAAIQGDQSG